MVNFVDAMNQGLQAADKLVADKREILAVINSASSQIERATDGAVRLEIREYEVDMSPANKLAALATLWPDRPKVAGLALTTKIMEGNDVFTGYRISEWTTTNGGYPVKLRADGSEITCFDKEALENGLAQVLGSPKTGQKLRDILTKHGVNGPIIPKPQLRRIKKI